MTLKELAVVLKLNAAQFQTGIKEASNSMEQFGITLERSRSSSSIMSNAMKALGGDVKAGFTAALGVTANIVSTAFNVIKTATLGLAGLLTGSVVEAARFGDAIDRAWRQAADGAERTGKEYEKFKQTAIDIGKSSLFSAIDVAKAMSIIADRARNTTQTMEEVAWATKLAGATGTDLSTSADSISRALMIFGKQGLTASQAANYLAVMSDKGALSLNEMGMAFRTLFPMAAAMGWQFKDIGAVLGVLSTKGIEGMRAIFALQGILDSALDPTKGLGKELANVGVQVVSTSGKVMPLLKIIEQMQSLGWTTQDVYKRFGVQMGTVFATIMSTGPKAFSEFGVAMDRAAKGTKTYVEVEEEMFKKTLPGALKALSSAADTQLTAIGDSFAAQLVPHLETLKEWINIIGDAIVKSGFLKTVLEGLTKAFAPNTAQITEMIKKWAEWIANIKPEDVMNAVKGIKDVFDGVVKAVQDIALYVKVAAETFKELATTIDDVLIKLKIKEPPTESEKWSKTAKSLASKPAEFWDASKTSTDRLAQNIPIPSTAATENDLKPTLQSNLVKQKETQEEMTKVILSYAGQIITIQENNVNELGAKLDSLVKGMKDKTSKPKPVESIY